MVPESGPLAVKAMASKAPPSRVLSAALWRSDDSVPATAVTVAVPASTCQRVAGAGPASSEGAAVWSVPSTSPAVAPVGDDAPAVAGAALSVAAPGDAGSSLASVEAAVGVEVDAASVSDAVGVVEAVVVAGTSDGASAGAGTGCTWPGSSVAAMSPPGVCPRPRT